VNAILTYPDDPVEYEFDVPLAPMDPEKYEPESLYPTLFGIPCGCPNCDKAHVAVFERQGFRLHDDGNIAVYKFVDVMY
jgi:hypothetical protein